MSSKNHPANRLQHETSPYLLQHAHNPVDWFPWGDEAFLKAAAEDKPVFLSVGYSACHWCHVMERESFENDDIAAVLNAHFVAVKVDREERPDVDQIYMTAVQALTQRGGWPMSVFLTPGKQPFFGGTYWPPTSRMGMRGFKEILLLIDEAWRNRRDDVVRSAESLTQAVDRMASSGFEPTDLSLETLRNAERELIASADMKYGGFGRAPKFPHPMDLRVLLRTAVRFQSEEAMQVARLTLDRMAAGGIYDHLGGGFHRYSTDERWLVPHFEKMLYDNALLATAYTEAWQVNRNKNDERVVRETLDYVLREMTSPDGGFYSTQDADSEGVEGKFFVWTVPEIESLLGPEESALICYAYDVSPEGNWEGHSILNRPETPEQAAAVLKVPVNELERRLASSKKILFEARRKRIAPGRDDKVLASWNGLMIAAFAKAGACFDEARYRDAAARACEFILTTMRTPDGRLLHTYKDGRARFNAYLDDYACVIDGLVETYQATFDARWLEAAVEIADRMLKDFSDRDQGGFYFTADDHEELITRVRDSQDNATPSGNGMAATALLKLGAITGKTSYSEAGFQTLQSLSGLLAEHPRASGQAVMALDFHLGPALEVVVIEGSNPAEAEQMTRNFASSFRPRDVIVRRPGGEAPSVLADVFEGKTCIEGLTTAYVCERGTCQTPLRDAAALRQALNMNDESSRRR